MGFGALATQMTVFDVFLGVIPSRTAGGHGQGHEHAGHDGADQEATQSDFAQQETDQQRCDNRQQRGQEHLFEGELGDDVNTGTVIRLGGTFHDARDFPELTANFLNHGTTGFADGLHGDGGEQIGQQATDEQTDDDSHVGKVEGHGGFTVAMHLEFHHVGSEQHQSSQTGGTDGVALGDGLGGVTNGIQRVGDGADALVHFSHLGNTTGVVGDRAVSVNGDNHTGHGEHGHGGHGNTVQAGKVESQEDGDADGQNRSGSRLHGDGQAGDDVGAVAGGGGFGNALHRAVDTGVELGDDNDDNGKNQADQRAVVNLHGGDVTQTAHELVAGIVEGDGGQDGGTEHAFVQGAHDVTATAQTDEEDGDHGSDNGDGAENQRELSGHGDFGEQQVADQHGGHGGDGIGLEQVGSHTGTVTDVVTDVVGDGGGVSGIVFGDTGFDLTHQVGTHVGAFGEDAAAETGEDGNQAATKAQGDQSNNVMGEGIVASHGGQGQTGNDHTGNGATLEGHGEASGHAFFGGFGGAHVGQNGNAHADVAGQKRGNGANHETKGGLGAHGGENNTKDDNTGNTHALELTVQVRNGAFLNGTGDGLHFLVSGRSGLHDTGKNDRKKNTDNTDQGTRKR
ncbi:hypothetical protein DESC_610203 [Desulfosarcina cetonica]|nr:hypothetical protein DESC_610203 [Desulfosarcina cetonica]